MAGDPYALKLMPQSQATFLAALLDSLYIHNLMISRTFRFIVAAGVLFAMACSSRLAHADEVLRWQADRLESLRSGDSWLTLVGLTWLQEGDNSFGSDPSHALVLTGSHVPPTMGRFFLADSVVTFFAAPGLEVMSAGELVDHLVLQNDSGGEPTILSLGTLTFYVIRRAGALAVRVKDSASEALARFEGLDYYPIDERWRVRARFVEHPGGGRQVAIPTFQGPTQVMESPGSLEFELDGQTHSLDAFAEAGADRLFIIFGDRTNGRETYGGGRFIYVPRADENGMVDLDFNRAYSPPCVFTPFATCPLPPPQNRLTARIEAGEKNYHSPSHNLGNM